MIRWRALRIRDAHLASKLSIETDDGIAEVASRVGYGSEAAFTRMFCRVTGEPPSTFRQREKGMR